MAKFCPNCGINLIENANFCSNCGYSLNGGQQAQQASTQNRQTTNQSSKISSTGKVIGTIVGLSILGNMLRGPSRMHGPMCGPHMHMHGPMHPPHGPMGPHGPGCGPHGF